MSKTAQKLTVFRAFLVVFKWGMFGAVPLGIGYYVVQHVAKPVQEELARPKDAPAVVDKNASGLVQAVQQTRLTVQKHDANTDYLNEIADASTAASATGQSASTAKRSGSAGPGAATQLRSTAGMSRVQAAVELLKIGAVIDGQPPRLLLDGKVVRAGEFVIEELGLRFQGLDAAQHVLVFASQTGQIYRRSY